MTAPQKVYYSAIVAGLGATGSAALHHLALRGVKALGLEAQPQLGHALGSSHGGSRIIRLVYQEDPAYVALLRRSYALWRDLEAATGKELLVTTGCLNASMPGAAGGHGHSCFDGAVRSAAENELAHEVLSAAAISRRFPGYSLPLGAHALLDPAGGFLRPERAIQAHVDAAVAAGAEVRCGEGVTTIEAAAFATGGAIEVRTQHATYRTDALIVTTGPWTPSVLPDLAPMLTVERQVVGWFRPPEPEASRGTFGAAAFPVFLLDDEAGYFYGFPADEEGLVKLGKYHHLGEVVAAQDGMDRSVHSADEAALRACLRTYFSALAAAPMERASVCSFTNTKDGHFILDAHPSMPGVVIGSACSGHGFKFAPVLGEVLADLATQRGATRHDIAMHRLTPARAAALSQKT